MGDGEEFDHDPAGGSRRCLLEQALEGVATGIAREQMGPVDEVEQRHRFATQAVDYTPASP